MTFKAGPPSADCCPINRGGICGFSSGSPSTPSCFDLTSSTVSLRGDAVSTVFNATGSRHREVLLHLMSRSSADQETPAPLGDVYGDRSYCFSSTSAAKAKIRERRADLWWRETGNLLVRMRRRKCVAVSAGLRCSEERPEQQGPRSPEDRAEEQRHSGHLPHFVQLCSQALLPDPQVLCPRVFPVAADFASRRPKGDGSAAPLTKITPKRSRLCWMDLPRSRTEGVQNDGTLGRGQCRSRTRSKNRPTPAALRISLHLWPQEWRIKSSAYIGGVR
ncbi:THAP domain-containing protein 2 [Arapaima gigas]